MLTDDQRGRADPRARRCGTCNTLLNRWDVDWDLADKPEGGPMVSFCIDGFYIGSPSFRSRYEAEGFHGLTFRPLSCGYFELRPLRTVHMIFTWFPYEFVIASRMTAMSHAIIANQGLAVACRSTRCRECGEAKMIYSGGAMVIAADQSPVSALEIVGTDLHLGDKSKRCFALIAGDGIRDSHKRKKMGGVSLSREVIHALPGPSGSIEALVSHKAARAWLRDETTGLARTCEIFERRAPDVAEHDQLAARRMVEVIETQRLGPASNL